MIRVGVAGAAGRMGFTVCEAVEQASDMELAGKADPSLDRTLAQLLDQDRPDIVVDFTTPATALENAIACLRAGVDVVIGTTGFDIDRLRAACESASGGAKALVAPNFAIGAVLMMRFAAEAARHMDAAEIVELHHDAKLDAPSGTAALTAQRIAEQTGKPAPPIHSVRLPGLVAHQEVILGALGQTLTIRHDSLDRRSFMPGVLLGIRSVAGLRESLTVGLEELMFGAVASDAAESADRPQSAAGTPQSVARGPQSTPTQVTDSGSSAQA